MLNDFNNNNWHVLNKINFMFSTSTNLITFNSLRKNPVICIGAALVDESFTCREQPIEGTSNPAVFYRSAGGVTGNIANHLARLGHPVELITHFGDDPEGTWLMDECRKSGMSITHSKINKRDTGRYVAMLKPNGELFIGSMAGFIEEEITIDWLAEKSELLKTASLIQIDCNLKVESIEWIIRYCREEKIPCIIEPVSIPKAARLRNIDIGDVMLITPNHEEIATLTGKKPEEQEFDLVQEVFKRSVKYLWIRKGSEGSVFYTADNSVTIPGARINVKDITGAGDAALAGWIHGWLLNKTPEECIRYGHALASIILQVKGAVNENLTNTLLDKTLKDYI